MRWMVAVALASVWTFMLPSLLRAEKFIGTSDKNSGNGSKKDSDEQLKKAIDRDDSRSVERQLGKTVKASLKDIPPPGQARADIGWGKSLLSVAFSLLRVLPIHNVAQAAQGTP